MKTTKVFLASSEELKHERLLLDSLFKHLNRIIRPRGLYLDSSMRPKHKQEEYNEELKTCEMRLVNIIVNHRNRLSSGKYYLKQYRGTQEDNCRILIFMYLCRLQTN